MGLFLNESEDVDPQFIAWNTSDAVALPFYGAGALLSVLFLLPNVFDGNVAGMVLPGLLLVFLSWKTLRALESHRNLSKLRSLYGDIIDQ